MLLLKKRSREVTHTHKQQKHLNSPLAMADSAFRTTGGGNLSLSMAGASLGRRVCLSGPHPFIPLSLH